MLGLPGSQTLPRTGTSVPQQYLSLQLFSQIKARIRMPAPTTTVAAGMAVTAVAAGVSVASFLQEWARRRESAAAIEELLELQQRRDQRLAEEAARQEARRKAGDATAGPQVLQPYGRAVELMQLHVASALDQLSASLRAAGVGSLSPVPLPGAEEPDLVAAYAALLLGRDVWGVMGPARMQALLTFGGTLAALSPTASRVVEEWLRRLGDAEGAILPGLMLAEESSGKEWAVGKGRRAAALSEEGMKVLQHLLVHVEEQFTEQGVQGEGGGSHPVAWIALMSLPQDDVPALAELLRAHLPGLALRPYITCTEMITALGVIVSVHDSPVSGSGFSLWGPSNVTVLVTSGVPGNNKKFKVRTAEFQPCRPIPQPPPYSAHAVPFREVQRCTAKLFAHTYLQRLVRAVQGRLQRMRGPFAWVAEPSGTCPEALAGCGAEHCAALSGCRQVLDDVLAQHALWGQVSEQLQQDQRQQRVVAGLKARLMQHLPPPLPPRSPQPAPAPHPTQPTSPPGQAANADEAARLVQLEREVDDFLSCLMPLTAARYMAVPRAGPAALPPQDVLAAEAVDAEAWRGVMDFVCQRAGARLALRHAHEERDRARREAVVTPWWLPPALYVAAVAVVAVVVLGLVHAAGGWLGRVSPQLLALMSEETDKAVGWFVPAAGTGGLLGSAAWRLLRAWRLWGAVLQAWLAVRWTVKLLPRDVAAGVVWVRDYLELGLFLGRHRLPDLQRRVDTTLRRWAVRLAEARMREAVARGSVSWAGVQAVMGALEAAAGPEVKMESRAGLWTAMGKAGEGVGAEAEEDEDEEEEVETQSKAGSRARARAWARAASRPRAVPARGSAEAQGEPGSSGCGASGIKGARKGRKGRGLREMFVEVVLPGSPEEVEAFLRLPVVEEEGQEGGQARDGKRRLQLLELVRESMGDGPGPSDGGHALYLPGPTQAAGPGQTRRRAGKAGRGADGGAGTGVSGVGVAVAKGGERARQGTDSAAAGDTAGLPEAPAGTGPTADGRAARRAGGRGHKAVSQRLEEDGWQVVRRGRHVVYRREVGGGRTQTFVRSATPSDWRTARNQLAELRRRNLEAEAEMVQAAAELAPPPEQTGLSPEVAEALARLLLGGMGNGQAAAGGNVKRLGPG